MSPDEQPDEMTPEREQRAIVLSIIETLNKLPPERHQAYLARIEALAVERGQTPLEAAKFMTALRNTLRDEGAIE